ncbi:MAG: right-handed parallel beta-helix repeat-containing protein, partial [Anaerolineales bacterium]|nr:right-handed parallel beta-helix repeat-containing protein [Anaerolineales bacterium]
NYNNLTDNNASDITGGFGMGDGIYLLSSSNNNLTNNIANNNNERGISLYSSSNNKLTDNIANNNGFYGIYLESSSDNNCSPRPEARRPRMPLSGGGHHTQTNPSACSSPNGPRVPARVKAHRSLATASGSALVHAVPYTIRWPDLGLPLATSTHIRDWVA